MKRVLYVVLGLAGLVALSAETWTATAPEAWAPVPEAISLTTEEGGGFTFHHTGDKNWCVNAIEPVQTRLGDRFTITCASEALPGDTTGNPFRLGVVLYGEGDTVLSWTYAERAMQPGESAQFSFIVPRGGTRFYVRLRGREACAARIRELRLERNGSVVPEGYVVPTDVQVASDVLALTVYGAGAEFSVTDRRTGRTWMSAASAGGCWLVTGLVCDSAANRVDAKFLDLETQAPFAVAFTLAKAQPEVVVEVDATPEIKPSLDYPPPLVTRAGENVFLPREPAEPATPGRFSAWHGGQLAQPFFGAAEGDAGAGWACLFETPDTAAVRVSAAADGGGLTVGPSWDPVKHVARVPRRVRYVFFEQGGVAAMRATYDAGVFDGDPERAAKMPTQAGFLVRDVAADGDYASIAPGSVTNGLRLEVKTQTVDGCEAYDVTLTETTGTDRALTLVFAMPLPAGEITWYGNLRAGETVAAGERSCTVAQGTAGRGWMTRWPFGAVSLDGKEEGYALGVDPEAPAFYRIAVNATTRQLYIAFDLGLAPEKNTAQVRFLRFPFPAADGLRGALVQYRALFPEAFRVRCVDQGVWTVASKIRDIPQVEDFGFKVRGRMSETDWDDAHNILTLRYTEPCTWWVNVPKAQTGTYTLADGLAESERLAAAGKEPKALGWKASVMHDEDGEPVGRCCAQSWCKGVLWSLNSAPGIAGGTTNDFTAKIDPPAFDARYAKPFPQGIDGEYMDSAELYCTPWCDYNRAHFPGMATPLCFARDSKRLAIFKGLIAYEYIREVARLAHGKGRLTLTNNTPDKWWWLTPFLDILGSETWWVKSDRKGGWLWEPMSDEELMFRRAMCGSKPYCFLMDAPFDHFTYAMTEKFMQRSLAYGVFPGFFTWHGVSSFQTNLYFSRPDLYERDRPLFKNYIPLCKAVAEAGWQPVNRVTASDNATVVTEQFGEFEKGTCYATVFNTTEREQQVRLAIRPPGIDQLDELVTATPQKIENGSLVLTLPPETVRVLCLNPVR